jgi:hypothetical protein
VIQNYPFMREKQKLKLQHKNIEPLSSSPKFGSGN